jgi:hypothetical protein
MFAPLISLVIESHYDTFSENSLWERHFPAMTKV